MKKITPKAKRNILHILIIAGGGVLEIGLALLIYLGLYNGLEAMFYPNNPTDFPAGILRFVSGIVLFAVYISLLWTKMPTFIKAMLSVAPNAVMTILIVLSHYESPVIFIGVSLLFVATSVLVIFKIKGSWLYYVGLGLGFAFGLIYALPR